MFRSCKKKQEVKEPDSENSSTIIHLADEKINQQPAQEIFTKKDNSAADKLPALRPISTRKANLVSLPNKTAKPIIQRDETTAPSKQEEPQVDPRIAEEKKLREQAIKELEQQFGQDDPLTKDEDMIRELMEKKRKGSKINIKQQFNQVGISKQEKASDYQNQDASVEDIIDEYECQEVNKQIITSDVIPPQQRANVVYAKHVEFDDEELHKQYNAKHQTNNMRNMLDQEIKKRKKYGSVKGNQSNDARQVGRLEGCPDRTKIRMPMDGGEDASENIFQQVPQERDSGIFSTPTEKIKIQPENGRGELADDDDLVLDQCQQQQKDEF